MNKISQEKVKILELLWEADGQVSLRQIAEKIEAKGQSANMHLIRLRKMGYVSKSESGYYSVTESGREAIGLPKIDADFARKVLSQTSPEKAFQFYSEIDQPIEVSSNSLEDLCEKMKTVDTKSVEFHTTRGDLEAWVSSLGDLELAKRLRLIRETELKGEALRERLYKTLRSRCDKLLQK